MGLEARLLSTLAHAGSPKAHTDSGRWLHEGSWLAANCRGGVGRWTPMRGVEVG